MQPAFATTEEWTFLNDKLRDAYSRLRVLPDIKQDSARFVKVLRVKELDHARQSRGNWYPPHGGYHSNNLLYAVLMRP